MHACHSTNAENDFGFLWQGALRPLGEAGFVVAHGQRGSCNTRSIYVIPARRLAEHQETTMVDCKCQYADEIQELVNTVSTLVQYERGNEDEE